MRIALRASAMVGCTVPLKLPLAATAVTLVVFVVTFPAVSVAVTVIVLGPGVRPLNLVLQVEPLTEIVPEKGIPLTDIDGVTPASTVPEMVWGVLLLTVSLMEKPRLGGVVSTLNWTSFAVWFPAASVAGTVHLLLP